MQYFFVFTALWIVPLWAATELKYPQGFQDFHVYAIDAIDYRASDFQGLVGAGRQILLKDFSILDMHPDYQHPFSSSVFTREFLLQRGSVHRGGVYAQDFLSLDRARVYGPLYSDFVSTVDSYYQGTAKIENAISFAQIAHSMWDMKRKLDGYAENNLHQSVRREGEYQILRANIQDKSQINWFRIGELSHLKIDGMTADELIVVELTGTRYHLQDLHWQLLGDTRAEQILFYFPRANYIEITRSGHDYGHRPDRFGIAASLFAPSARMLLYDALITGSLYAYHIRGDLGCHPGAQINQGKFRCFAEPGACQFE